jgi:hypothetical protein
MPNHVTTKLIVTGPKHNINQFIAKAKSKESVLDFQSLYPMPKELMGVKSPVDIVTEEARQAAIVARDNLPADHILKKGGLPITQAMSDEYIAKYGFNNWYDWKCTCWGTKWGCYDVGDGWDRGIRKGVHEISIFYQTAWSPATAFWEQVSTDFPELTFKHYFSDEGGGFIGYETFQEGTIIEEGNFDWNSTHAAEVREILAIQTEEEAENE